MPLRRSDVQQVGKALAAFSEYETYALSTIFVRFFSKIRIKRNIEKHGLASAKQFLLREI